MSIVNVPVAKRPAVVAAFDVGSNSIKMTVARRGANSRGPEEFLWRSETVRLGQGIEQTNRLADDRIVAAMDTLTRFAAEAREHGAQRLIGVATEATRVADNGPAFLSALSEQTGIEIQTITGDREAELTFLGLDGVVDLSGIVIVADIGGGSTELILARDRHVEWAQSFSLGSGRLTDRFLEHDPPSVRDLASCIDYAERVIAGSPAEQMVGGRLIVVGGTGEYLDRLIPSSSPRTPAALDLVLKLLTERRSEDVAIVIGASQSRARVLPAGIAIAEAVARLARPSALAVAQSGIRRGLLLAAFAGEI